MFELLQFVPSGGGHPDADPPGPLGGGGGVDEEFRCDGGVRPTLSPPRLNFSFISGQFSFLDVTGGHDDGWWREMVTVVAADQDLTPVALVKNMLVVLVRGSWSL